MYYSIVYTLILYLLKLLICVICRENPHTKKKNSVFYNHLSQKMIFKATSKLILFCALEENFTRHSVFSLMICILCLAAGMEEKISSINGCLCYWSCCSGCYSRLMKEFNSSFPFYFVNSVEVIEKSKLVICFYFRKCNFVVNQWWLQASLVRKYVYFLLFWWIYIVNFTFLLAS